MLCVLIERQFRVKRKEIGTTSVVDRTKLILAAVAAVQILFFGMIAFMTGNFLGVGLMVASIVIIYLKRKEKMTRLKLGAIAVLVICFCWNIYLLVMGMTPGIALLLSIFLLIVVGGGIYLITAKNRQIARHNKMVEQNNERVQAQRNELYSRFKKLTTEMQENSKSWFCACSRPRSSKRDAASGTGFDKTGRTRQNRRVRPDIYRCSLQLNFVTFSLKTVTASTIFSGNTHSRFPVLCSISRESPSFFSSVSDTMLTMPLPMTL